MMKVWRGDENKDDKIIAISDRAIYKGNPDNLEINHCITDIQNGVVPQKDFITIPLNYIREIQLQENKSYIALVFAKDSEEHLRINDSFARNEVFNYFKENIPNTKFYRDEFSRIRSGRKPLIAMGVVFALFLWSLYYALEFNKGNQLEISNGHYNSLTGIVLAIASYGVKNVILVFGALLAIALWAFIRKFRNPPIINRIILIK